MRTGCEPTRFGNEAKTIIHGDALAELKKLPTESVDLIFADLTCSPLISTPRC
ncbi:DNA adenine methylase [Escherichia coli]|nr:DNA adenine methylase [Escherichia coli]